MFKILQSFATGVAMLVFATLAQATVSFSGTFVNDDNIRLLEFVTQSTGAVTIETFGYAGGIDGNGNVVARGGFDPIFALFNFFTGALIAIGDDGALRTDPVTGAAFDALLTLPSLAAGRYVVALGQFDNFPLGPNLSNGFLETGNPTFTSAFGCSNGRFCDINGFNRTGSFDISINGQQVVSATPEPGSLALIGLGFPGLWLALRRRSARHAS